jgi:gliding motility-associated-like protein
MTASLFIEVGTCSVTDILELLVKKEYEVFVPNIFSVNGDGLNDQLVIYAGSEVESILDFQIYDRWGGSVFTQKLFAPNDPSLGWDGQINGVIANVGVYTYFIDVLFVDGHIEQFKGSVTITK